MHGRLDTDLGFTLMCADTPAGAEVTTGTASTVSLTGDDAAELLRYWQRLSEGGTVTRAMDRQTWGDDVGMCSDRSRVPWRVDISS